MKLKLPKGLILRKVAAAGLTALATFAGSVGLVAAEALNPADPWQGLALLAVNTFGPVLSAYLVKESKDLLEDALDEGQEVK